MDTPTLISNLVKALAWPAGLVVTVAMVRPALLDRLGHLRSIKFRGIEAEFGEELARVREIAEGADLVKVPHDQGLTEAESDKFLRLAGVSPRSAVVEAWGVLEAQAREIVDQRRPRTSDAPLTAALLGEALADLGILDSEGAQAFYLLRALRNQAVHEPHLEITTDQALEYGNLTRGLADSLASQTGGSR